MSVQVKAELEAVYLEGDRKPILDDTLQGRYIVYLFDNLKGIFRNDPNAFVAAGLLWYPA